MFEYPVLSIIDDELSLREAVPVLMRVTASSYGRGLAHALEAGFACLLTKPFNEAELFSCSHSVLKTNRGIGRHEMNVDVRSQSYHFKP